MVEKNKEKGFIKIYRTIWDNPISNKPNYIAIWIYLISHANYTDKEKIINNKKILIKKGTFICSLRKISEHFDISISTVKYIIDYFVSEHMIEYEPSNKFSLFKIKKYNYYNDIEQSIECKTKANETQIKTTNKDKKEKNIYNSTSVLNPLKDLFKMPDKKVPTYQWQDEALEAIKILKGAEEKKSSVFKCFKYNNNVAKLAMSDCRELNKIDVMYFLKLFNELSKK